MQVTFESQSTDIYGYPISAYPSPEGDSTYFVTPGRKELDRRMLAAFSKVRRQFGYEPLLKEYQPIDYIEYVWGRVDFDDHNPDIVTLTFMSLDEEKEEGYQVVTLVEF